MSYASKLWRRYQQGKETLTEVCERLIRGVAEDDFEREIDSMPPEMLQALAAYVAPTDVDESGSPQWESLSISMLEMHAFEFEFEKACDWKTGRMKTLHILCQRKLDDGGRQT